ncbi:MAG: sulfatase-like hydrolase/transferase [Anaerolineales bacterium]|nr:MAG: sulfatase-like hydrolase/transferase [Anaerolineales bacterium]
MDQWKKLLIHTTLAAYLYISMEWLFFATKPSFLNGMSLYENLVVLFVSGGMAALLFIVPILVLFAVKLAIKKENVSKVIFRLAVFSPALLLSSLILVLVDNFTYTVFKFGIVTSTGIWRGIYGLVFLYLIWVSSQWILQSIRTTALPKFLQFLPLGLIAISSLLAGEQFLTRRLPDGSESTATLDNRPNILLIGSDGINAESMSVYGYQRNTTPFLDEIASSTLFAENAFANWNTSAGSTTSMLTGKHPLETEVYNAQGILTEVDSYQHLPGILRRYGYFSVQLGVLSFVDAYAVNLQDAFDVANGRMIDQNPIFQAARKLGQGDSTYFIMRIFERIIDRLLHIYYVRQMTNPFSQVILSGNEVALSDDEKIEETVRLVNNTEAPIFLHVHLMGTHGPRFSPAEQVFSAGKEQTQEWMPDFYDDAVLTFDSHIRKLYGELERSGELENTIIIIYSDHGMAYQIQRVPVIFHFPDGAFASQIQTNVQNIDIAPTLLDYLEIPIPSWMEGHSLLRGAPHRDRILVTGTSPDTLRIVQCEVVYMVNTDARAWLIGEVKEHSAPCKQTPENTSDIPKEIIDLFSNINEQYDGLENYLVFHFFDYGIATRADLSRLILLYTGTPKDELPAPQGIFADVPMDNDNASIIEYAYQQGLMDSCQTSPLSFCPQEYATRQEAAVAMLRGLLGDDYIPSSATGMFSDVPVESPYAPWIEELYHREITAGCSKNPLKYCPASPLLTEHLLVFLAKTFSGDEK